jgi:hypothetical protein
MRARSEAVITPPCHGGDRRFDPGRARQDANKNAPINGAFLLAEGRLN